jgi:hypothetical protein
MDSYLREQWHERPGPNYCTYGPSVDSSPTRIFLLQHLSVTMCAVLKGEHYFYCFFFLGGGVAGDSCGLKVEARTFVKNRTMSSQRRTK